MKRLPIEILTLSATTLQRVLASFAFLIVLCLLSPKAVACDRSSVALDSVVCESGNYRIYLSLCVGGGATGVMKGAGGDTRTFAFGFYSTNASMAVQSFTPATVTGDSTGTTLVGNNYGPIPTSPFFSQANVLYIDPGDPAGFMCTLSTNLCGNVHTQCNQYSFLVNAMPDSLRMFAIEGGGNPVGGCYPNPDMGIDFTGPLADAGMDTLICRGDTISLGGNSSQTFGSNATYSWTPPGYLDNAAVANPNAWPQTTTTYTMTVAAQQGCVGIDAVKVTVDSACVWPGDCNYDLTANYLDIWPIGLAYNYIGPIRPTQGFGWFAHAAYDWSGSFLNGPNHKHADSNGDGIVNVADVGGILANYGQSHNGNRITSGGTGVKFALLPDSTLAGDTLWIVANLGTADYPEDSVYGVGFQLYYPPALVDSGGVVVRYDSSWLGTVSLDMITIDVDNYQNGVVEVGITRIDHQDTSGYGEICRIGIAMQDDISAKVESFIAKTAAFQLDGAAMVAADERITFLSGDIDSVVVWQSTLPVTWKEFYGTVLDEGIQLNWSTLLEINSDRFSVERAVPGGGFSSLETLPAAGNSTSRSDYQYLDQSPETGENLYRIVETDRDGSTTNSSVISVFFGEPSNVSVTVPPQFLGDQLTFSASSTTEQAADFQLYDLKGQQIMHQSIRLTSGTQRIQQAVGDLSTGVYLFHLKTSTSQFSYKLIRY